MLPQPLRVTKVLLRRSLLPSLPHPFASRTAIFGLFVGASPDSSPSLPPNFESGRRPHTCVAWDNDRASPPSSHLIRHHDSAQRQRHIRKITTRNPNTVIPSLPFPMMCHPIRTEGGRGKRAWVERCQRQRHGFFQPRHFALVVALAGSGRPRERERG